MKEGITYNSRKQANFVQHIKPVGRREQHIKEWIATCNWQELIPYVEILEHDEHYREIKYRIKLPSQS